MWDPSSSCFSCFSLCNSQWHAHPPEQNNSEEVFNWVESGGEVTVWVESGGEARGESGRQSPGRRTAVRQQQEGLALQKRRTAVRQQQAAAERHQLQIQARELGKGLVRSALEVWAEEEGSALTVSGARAFGEAFGCFFGSGGTAMTGLGAGLGLRFLYGRPTAPSRTAMFAHVVAQQLFFSLDQQRCWKSRWRRTPPRPDRAICVSDFCRR